MKEKNHKWLQKLFTAGVWVGNEGQKSAYVIASFGDNKSHAISTFNLCSSLLSDLFILPYGLV